MWVIGSYVLLLLWVYALLRCYRDVTQAVRVGFSRKLLTHATWRILLALLICIGSLVISLVPALLWPLWIPVLVYQVMPRVLGTLLWLLRGTFRLCLRCAKKLSRIDPFLFYKPWFRASPAPSQPAIDDWCWSCQNIRSGEVVGLSRLCTQCRASKYVICSVCHGLVHRTKKRICADCPVSILCEVCPCPCTGADEG